MKNKFSKEKGFTLIEILVVATIIGLLSALAIANFSTANKSSRDAKRKADLEQVRTALEIYRSQVGYYPSSATFQDIGTPLAVLVPDDIAALPTDPKPVTGPVTTPYMYICTTSVLTKCYGYCLEANLEIVTASNQCLPISLSTGYKLGVRHP